MFFAESWQRKPQGNRTKRFSKADRFAVVKQKRRKGIVRRDDWI
jgi:hypothetical protein